MVAVRKKDSIYQAAGRIENGTFQGRWHFSFGDYYDSAFERFGSLRVFNDDTLSPGAIWPLHPHRDNEVVTYIAGGEFRHADEHGKGGILKQGWVQHTTVGSGMWHSEINNLTDKPLRFIQMWFLPTVRGLPPSVEQRAVDPADRTDRLLPLVSNSAEDALTIVSDAAVYSSRLRQGSTAALPLAKGQGAYIYVLEGGTVVVNNRTVAPLDAAMVIDEQELCLVSKGDAEVLVVVVPLEQERPGGER